MSARRPAPPAIALLAALLAPAGSMADELGRLFTTPAQRQQIDALRRGQQPAVANDDGGDRLTLNGVMTSSRGRQRVWINGSGQRPGGPGSNAILLRDGRVRLRWRGGHTPCTLKPGQTVDRIDGQVYEPYEQPVEAAMAPAEAGGS